MCKQALIRVVFYVSMTLFGIAALAINTLCWLLAALPRSKRLETFARCMLYYLMRFWMWYLCAVGILAVTFPKIGELRRMRGIVLVANHPSLLDICWVLAASPHVTCYIKSDIRKNSFFNAIARMAGYVSNDSGLDGLHEAVARVNEGDILCVFPEGTRTQRPPMNPMKPGFALVARQAGAPIQILYIRTNSISFSKGVFFRCGPMPIRIDIALGPRFEPDSSLYAHRSATRVEKAMRSDLESAGPWL
jgi:1-acyl-sn-glycerol-3-phosphate acyltransferase